MPRISPIDPDVATGDTATHLASVRKLLGGTPNLFTTAAHSSVALGVLASMFANLGKSSVGGRTGELLAIAIAQSNGCGYCLAAHTAIGTALGLGADALAAARTPTSADARTASILSLAVSINRSRGKISDAELTAARAAGLSDREIVDVVALVALNVFTNYLNNVAETTIDFPEVPLLAAA
jgi:uncharacterized peroxidase-related enzyme